MYSEFMKLCKDRNFKPEDAQRVLANIDLSREFTIAPEWKGERYSPMPFTPLSMASFYINLPMVELLLSMGANPDIIYNGHENVLWDLQYWENVPYEDNETRLIIAKCLLENGANPRVIVEGEELYAYVLACSQDDMGEQLDYRMRFLDLLEEYLEK